MAFPKALGYFKQTLGGRVNLIHHPCLFSLLGNFIGSAREEVKFKGHRGSHLSMVSLTPWSLVHT